MFSKSRFIALVALLLSLLSVNCSRWLNEDPPAPTVIELDKDRSRCLRNWSETVDKYLLNKSTFAEINEFWSCLDSVITHFQKHARGDTPGLYSISELRKFLEDFFLSPRKIPNELVEQIKDLKYAIFSGDRNNFNQEDLKRLHFLLNEFKLASAQLLPYVSYLTFSASNDSKLDGAISTVVDISERWQKQLSPIHGSYRLEDLLKFWSELKRVLDVKAFEIEDKKWDQFLRAAKSVKSLLVGAPGEEILKDDWPILYQRLSDALTIAWLYKYRFKEQSWQSQTAVEAIKTVFKLMFRSIRSSTLRHKNQRIPLSQFDEIANMIADNSWLGTDSVRPDSLSSALRSLVMRIGRDATASRGNDEGLSASGLNFIERVAAHWTITQTAINHVFEKNKRITRNEFAKRWKDFSDHAYELTDDYFLAEKDVVLNLFYGTLKQVTMRTTRGPKMLFVFSNDRREKNYIDYEAASQLNWIYRLVNIIYYGYGESLDSITMDQFDTLYKEVRELGIDLKLLDPRVTNSARRTFIEANTFTFSADGDKFMSLPEAMEEIQILISGGVTASSLMTAATDNCIFNFRKCLSKKVDQFGRIPLEVNFFKKFLADNFSIYFSHLPNLVRDFNSWDYKTQKAFISMVVDAVTNSEGGNWITLGGLRTISGILHFAESIMLRYDNDMSNTIEALEINNAFYVFQPFLSDAIYQSTGKRIDPESLRVGFAYFLEYGDSIISGNSTWDTIISTERYLTMKSRMAMNWVHLTRFQIVRAMINFKSFTKSN